MASSTELACSQIFDNGTNVGINTTTPDAKLHVDGDSYFGTTSGTNPLRIGRHGARDALNEEEVRFSVDDTWYTQHYIQDESSANFSFQLESTGSESGSASFAELQANSNGLFNWNNKLYVSTNGNVGINSTTPTSQLHVIGTGAGDGTWNQGILVENTNSTTGEPTVAFNNAGTGSNYWFTGLNQSGHYDIAYGSTFTNGNTHIRVESGGNIGIGTVSPTSQLHTTGTIRFANYTNGFLQVDGVGNLSVGTGSDLFTAGDGLEWSGNTLNSIWKENGTHIYNGNSGNVGVGTTTPDEKLEVSGRLEVDNGGSGALAYLKGGADDTSYEWVGFYSGENRQGIMLWDGSWSGAGNRTNEFSITAENGNWLTLTSATGTSILGGNVGVGTTSPSSKLEVDGWIGRTAHNNGALVGSYNNIGSNGNYTNPIYVIGSSYKPDVSALSNMYGIGYSHANASFINNPTSSWGMYVAADGDARIWLAASASGDSYFNAGDVGIGTTTPDQKLDIYGATENIEITNTSETDAGIFFNDAQALTSQYAKILYNCSTNDLSFLNASGTPRMVIESSGEVGIGTTNPTEKLYVSGGSVYANSNNGEWAELADNVWEGLYARSNSDDGAQGYTSHTSYSGVRGDGPGYMEVDRSIWGDDYYYSEGGAYGRGYESWGSGGSYDEKGGTGVFADGTNTGVVGFGGDVDYWKNGEVSIQTLFQDGMSTGTGIASHAANGARISGSQIGVITRAKGMGLLASSDNNISAYFNENTVSKGSYTKLLSNNEGDATLTYSIVSEKNQIIITGSSQLSGGIEEIQIDPVIAQYIEGRDNITVSVTPTQLPDGFWAVTDKSADGFTVSANGQGFTFDYVFIASLTSNLPLPEEVISSEFSGLVESATGFQIKKVEKPADDKSMLFSKEERDEWERQNLSPSEINSIEDDSDLEDMKK
jgi:hypothetical protein